MTDVTLRTVKFLAITFTTPSGQEREDLELWNASDRDVLASLQWLDFPSLTFQLVQPNLGHALSAIACNPSYTFLYAATTM